MDNLKHFNSLSELNSQHLGQNVPRRRGHLAPKIAQKLLNYAGWTIVGEIPNIQKAVILAVPHTSNMDGVWGLATIIALDIDIKMMGKKELFKVPILANFLRWAGVIAIDRANKGSTLQASIDRYQHETQLFLGIAPEGTRDYTEKWKTGFYYMALGANVPIIPVAMDYPTKQVRFMPAFYPTGDIEADLPQLYAYYHGVKGKDPSKMSQPLQDLNSSNLTKTH